MSEPEWIAESTFWVVDKDGRGFDVGLQIGKPYKTDFPDEWACPVAMIGLHRRFPDIHGIDSWQALVLAIDLTRKILTAFVEIDGGRLHYEEGGAEATVDELFGIWFNNPEEEPVPDGPLTPEQEVRVGRLTVDELAMIDAVILRNCSQQFRKIARVVARAMHDLSDTIPHLSDIFYADRVRHLVAVGKLESQGNIAAMRFGEVKLTAVN